jgi:hypothetical protein
MVLCFSLILKQIKVIDENDKTSIPFIIVQRDYYQLLSLFDGMVICFNLILKQIKIINVNGRTNIPL